MGNRPVKLSQLWIGKMAQIKRRNYMKGTYLFCLVVTLSFVFQNVFRKSLRPLTCGGLIKKNYAFFYWLQMISDHLGKFRNKLGLSCAKLISSWG